MQGIFEGVETGYRNRDQECLIKIRKNAKQLCRNIARFHGHLQAVSCKISH